MFDDFLAYFWSFWSFRTILVGESDFIIDFTKLWLIKTHMKRILGHYYDNHWLIHTFWYDDIFA